MSETEARPTVNLGRELFRFESFDRWVDTSSRLFRRHHVSSSDVVCLDQRGRICTIGSHYQTARREDAYPIVVYANREPEEGAS